MILHTKYKKTGFRNLLLLSVFSGLIFISCTKDFEEINTNPHGFTTATDGSLFNNVIQSMVPTGNEMFYVWNEILYKQTQLAALTKSAWGNYTIGTEEIWSNYYTTLPEIRELQRRIDTYDTIGEIRNMRAMLKIVLAMKTFKVTDYFGDIPYSEAGYGFQNLDLLRPKYDAQRDIYLSLLEDLAWADANIDLTGVTEEPFSSFVPFDKLFNGDMLKWQKLANSLRLRYALRMSEVEPEAGGAIIKDIIENDRPVIDGYDFITSKLESACLWPVSAGFKFEGLNWSFREHENLRMGSVIWSYLSYHDSTDGSGIFDPRAMIYFETNNANAWRPYPQNPTAETPAEGGIPYETHRDQDGAFSIKGETNIYSPFNFFMIRDEDQMPIIFITGAEVHYIKSEAYFRGIGVAEDKAQAEIEYFNGINSSVEWWLQRAANSKLPTSGIEFPDMISIPQWLNAATVQGRFGFWNATTEEEKLRFIYAQWWLDAFRQPEEAFALARRTGMTPREGDPLTYFRLPYPPSEAAYNAENMNEAISRQGSDVPETKLWWMK
ncbi:MAG: SusD/RagB family nutrient-binding outer membrane lipoprotein [Bacteroidales bacterium]